MLKFRWETDFKKTELGEVPRDWEEKRVGDILDIKYGKGLPKKDRTTGCVPVYGSSGIVGYHDKPFAMAPGLIIGRKGNVGSVHLSKTDFFPIDTVFYAENVKNSTFLYYMLSKVDFEQLMSDSAVPGLNINFLKSVKIPYPPPDEQSRIAIVLSWFDDLIENKKKQNEILEKTAMAIFKSWFVDFEPFKDGEFSYNDELDKEIPKEWKVVELKEIIEFNPKVKLKKGETYPFIEMKQVSTNSMVCEYGFKKFSGSGVRFKGGDTLLARITPSLENGKTAIVWFLNRNQAGFGTTEFIVMRPKREFLREFVYLLARDGDFREHAISSMGGTSGRQRVEKEALETYKIPVPPQSILEKFHTIVEPLFSKIIINQREIMVLKKVRDALLPLLVFGRLRVEEV